MQAVKQRVQQLISKNKLDQAFTELGQVSGQRDEDWQNTLILLQARHSDLKRKEMMGVVAGDQAGVERAQIVNGLLQLIADLDEGGASLAPAVPTQPSVQPSSTDQTKILFLAANPTDTGRIRLDVEYREISEGLRRSEHRDQYHLVTWQALRPQDLQRAMLDTKPQIVHFSGHGVRRTDESPESDDLETRLLDWGQGEDERYIGGIALERNDGKAHIVKAEALGGLFGLFAREVRCVLLNACYSELQAEALKPHVAYIIGMNTAVPDQTAIAFATAFYDGLGAGRGIPFAFELAKNALLLQDLPGADIPVMVEGQASQ